jgi:ribosomal protein L29
VDYDRIFTLNVSATQELAAQVEQLKKELTAARAENAALRQDMNNRLAKLESMATGTAQK